MPTSTAVPVAGTVYHVKHSGKGEFVMHVTSVTDDFASGTVVEGEAVAFLLHNVAYSGDPITVRISFCTFTPYV